MVISPESLVVAVRRDDDEETAQQSLRAYAPYVIDYHPIGMSRWSLQQKLILDCCNYEDYGLPTSLHPVEGARVHIGDDIDSLFATMLSSTNESEFVYMAGENAAGYRVWSLQQILQANVPHDPSMINTTPVYGNPSQFGSTLFMQSNNNTVEMLSKYHNGSCLLLWMSDHFGDGWDSLVLTVRAPDTTNDSFSPRCDQVDPFQVRYCPYAPEDEGVYIVKPFAPANSRFYWEVSWQVQVESTGVWYKGDANSRLLFDFNSTTLEFSFAGATNAIDIVESGVGTQEVYPCFRCGAVTVASWRDLQDISDTSFWPFTAVGAPYYISDIEARTVYFSGRVCDGIANYECYQTLAAGKYLMRQGGGHFGKIIGFPYTGASWEGCGTSGTWNEQLIFQIVNASCFPMQVC